MVAKGKAPSLSDLRVHLKKTLPDYMVPSDFVSLPIMPLTPSGKIDRRALPAPDASQRESESQFVAPRSPTEELLSKLWATALNVARVSVEDDFFALGGHSLLASQILARLRRDHGIELSFRKFFEAPTIARLATLIDGAPAAAPRTQPLGVKRRAPGTSVPLSIAQERLWLLEEMYPAQRFAAQPTRGLALCRPRSSRPPAAEPRSHRGSTRIDAHDARGERQQSHAAFRRAGLAAHREVDLRSLPEAEREPKMFASIREQTAELFDLERGPLFRSTLSG